MTDEQIIELARQAGFINFDMFSDQYSEETQMWHQRMKAFAKLVAQHEREACARVCEELRDDWLNGLGRYEFMGEGADYCADAIRARGENV